MSNIKNRDRWIMMHLQSYLNLHKNIIEDLKKEINNNENLQLDKINLFKIIKRIEIKYDKKIANIQIVR